MTGPLIQHQVISPYQVLYHRFFHIKHGQCYCDIHPIASGLAQGSMMVPYYITLYRGHTYNSWHVYRHFCLLSHHTNPHMTSTNLQIHLSLLEVWLNKCIIKIDEKKITLANFTLNRPECPAVFLKHYRNTTVKEALIWTKNSAWNNIYFRKGRNPTYVLIKCTACRE